MKYKVLQMGLENVNCTTSWMLLLFAFKIKWFKTWAKNTKCTFKSNQTFVILPVSITANMSVRFEGLSSTTVFAKTGTGRQVAGTVSIYNISDTFRLLWHIEMKGSVTAQHIFIERSVNRFTTALKDTGKHSKYINACRVFEYCIQFLQILNKHILLKITVFTW